VKRDYGATGDGKADDTAAIQKVLDELREHKKFCVLYFPAGRDEHEALRDHPQPC
jgi:polygalacturonase